MLARIYRPAKTAMQSGKAKSRDWRLEFEPASARTLDPLMGWTSSTDMNGQVRLSFETKEEAVAYAERHGITFEDGAVMDPAELVRLALDGLEHGEIEILDPIGAESKASLAGPPRAFVP